MTLSPYKLASLTSDLIQDRFLVIWLVLLAVVLSWAYTRRVIPVESPPFSREIRRQGAALVLFGLFLAGYVFLIFFRADFADIDDSIIALPIVGAGRDVPSVWPHLGRFFPFGNREWFLVRQVTAAPVAHHGLVVVELLVLLGILYRLLREFEPRIRTLVLSVLLLAPSFLMVFAGLVFPERNLVFLVALLMLLVQPWAERPSSWRLAAALGVTHAALYYKEPAFLIVTGFAAMRLVLAWAAQGKGNRSVRSVLQSHPLEVGMIVLSAVFLGMYLALMFPHQSTRYITIDGEPLSLFAAVWLYVKSNPVFAVFLGAAMVRAAGLVRRREAPDPFWDAFAFGALLYAGTFFWLGMRRPYYMAPVDLVGVVCLAHWARTALEARRIRPWLLVAGGGAAMLLTVCQSWFVMTEKKNVIYGKTRIVEVLRERVRGSTGPVRLHLPYTRAFVLMEFASFLELKGLRVARWPEVQGDLADVVLEGPPAFSRGRCVSWIAYRCDHAVAPSPGALLVVLPDDETPGRERRGLRPAEPVTFAYRPYVVPAKLEPALRRLRAVMDPGWRRMYLRQDWMWGYVAEAAP